MGWYQRPKPGIVRRSQTVTEGETPVDVQEAIRSQRDHREADRTSQPPIDERRHAGAPHRRGVTTGLRFGKARGARPPRVTGSWQLNDRTAGGAMIVISTRASRKHRRARGDLWIKTWFFRRRGRAARPFAVVCGARPADAVSVTRSPAHPRASIDAEHRCWPRRPRPAAHRG